MGMPHLKKTQNSRRQMGDKKKVHTEGKQTVDVTAHSTER
jgi:hypothetical protein